MTRCELANTYHHSGYNCAQSVLAAFEDLTHISKIQAAAIAGGFGGGMGGSGKEVCGAISGGVMALSLMSPFLNPSDKAEKRKMYAIIRDFRKRFHALFSYTICGDLLRNKVSDGDKPSADTELGLTDHCDIMVVTAVALIEEMLQESGVDC